MKRTGRIKQPLKPDKRNAIREALLKLRSVVPTVHPQRIKMGRNWFNLTRRKRGGAKFSRRTQMT